MKSVMKKMILPLLVLGLGMGHSLADEIDPALSAALGHTSTDCVAGTDSARQATAQKDQSVQDGGSQTPATREKR